MRLFACLCLLVAGLGLSGCASYVAEMQPGKSIGAYRHFWVKSNFDDNHAMDRLITEALRRRGLQAECGPLTMLAPAAEAIVTFRDHWTWDFKDHLSALELSVTDAKSEKPVARAIYSGPASMSTSSYEAVDKLVEKLLGATPPTPELGP